MSATIHTSQPSSLSLTDIFDEKKFSATSQLKYSATQGGFYSDSKKAVGTFGAIGKFWDLKGAFYSFCARFISKSFSEANKQLVEAIRNDLGEGAAKAFEQDFGNRSRYGQPITAARVRAFVASYSETIKGDQSLLNALTPKQQAFALYGPKTMQSNYERLFQHGTVRECVPSVLRDNFFSPTLSDSKATTTLLSPNRKSLGDMGYMTDPDSNPDNLLLPSSCVQILGSTARAQLLDPALYEPESRKKDVKKHQLTIGTTLEEASTRLTILRQTLAEGHADAQTTPLIQDEVRNSEVQTDYFAKQGYFLTNVDSWSPKQLAAYAQMHALVQELTAAPQKKLAEIAQLQQKLDRLTKKAETSPSPEIEAESSKLASDIETGKVDLANLQVRCSSILMDARKSNGWQSWTPERQLQFVHHNRLDPISFGRIKLKVNGQFLPYSDSQSFDENFSIFKEVLQQLNPGFTVTEDHFHELISLCDRNKTTAGTPSGAYNAEDHLPAFGQAASLIPTEINFYEIKLSPDSKSFDFHFDSGRCLLNSITFNGGAQDHLTPNFLYAKGEISVSGQAASLPADFLILERQCKFTWRYTPIAEEEGGNMGFGSLDLVDSRQRFCPLERKHAAALDARTQPFVNKARSAFETTINTPDPASTDSYSATTHVWLGDIQDGPAISDAFYKDLRSGSDKRGVCFLETTPREAPSRLYQKGISSDSLSVAETLQFEKAEESKMATACQKFVAFVGDKDQALAISRYATQHVSPQILIHELGEAGVLVLPPYGKGETSGNLDYKFTFSKSVKGETVMEVSCEQKPKCFNISLKLIELTADSYLDLNYKITFRFEAGKPQPLLEVSDVNYNYSLEETKSPKFS